MHWLPFIAYVVAAVMFFLDAYPKISPSFRAVSWGFFALTVAIALTFIIFDKDGDPSIRWEV